MNKVFSTYFMGKSLLIPRFLFPGLSTPFVFRSLSRLFLNTGGTLKKKCFEYIFKHLLSFYSESYTSRVFIHTLIFNIYNASE